MTIQSNTISITYGDTTRPITFAWNDEFNKQSCNIICATILNTFKDLIPDYQKYQHATMPFNVWKDKEGTLTLPHRTFKFTIQTLGHGELEIEIDNEFCKTFFYTHNIKAEIQKQLGIPIDCIELCDEEGNSIMSYHTYYSNKTTLFAIFTSYEEEVIKQGYEIIQYKSKFKEGRLMRMRFLDQIGNYEIVRFEAEIKTITKRTPKMITLDDETNSKKKISTKNIGEYFKDFLNHRLVAWDERIQYGKEYAIAFSN
jgi:hypothetical protein